MSAERDALREKLADLSHRQWSGWMRYLVGRAIPRADGSVLIGAQDAQRWARQMKTPYADLSEQEKESDRSEADRVLALLPAPAPSRTGERDALVAALVAEYAHCQASQGVGVGRQHIPNYYVLGGQHALERVAERLGITTLPVDASPTLRDQAADDG